MKLTKLDITKIFDDLKLPRSSLSWIGEKEEYAAINKESTDGVGSHLVRAFLKKNGGYEEVDLDEAKDKLADYLAPHIQIRTLLKEVLEKLPVEHFIELLERIEKKGKVTLGVQKGSCVWLYVKGKQGKPFPLQITE